MSKASENPRKALGKGLSALLGPKPTQAPERPEAQGAVEEVLQVPVDQIDPNPLQSRTVFQADRLQELAQSIQANGVIQPLVTRLRGGRYQLVAGERRWRASKLAGLAKVPPSCASGVSDGMGCVFENSSGAGSGMACVDS